MIQSTRGSPQPLTCSKICGLQFTDQGSTKEKLTRPLRKVLAKDPVGPGETVMAVPKRATPEVVWSCPIIQWHAGRGLAYKLAKAGKEWRSAAAVRMPEARGDIREIVGQPVFVPLQKLAIIYGKACTCQHLASCMPQVVRFPFEV